MVEREFADKFVHRHDLGVIAGVPAEQGEEVDDSLRQIARLAVARRDSSGLWIVPFEGEDREAEAVAVALREFAFAVGLEQQGQVHEVGARVGPAECLVEKHVEGCRGEPFLTADHVGDFHQVVVDNVGQVIGGQIVGALVEHFVIEDRRIDGHLSAEQVVDLHVAARLD